MVHFPERRFTARSRSAGERPSSTVWMSGASALRSSSPFRSSLARRFNPPSARPTIVAADISERVPPKRRLESKAGHRAAQGLPLGFRPIRDQRRGAPPLFKPRIIPRPAHDPLRTFTCFLGAQSCRFSCRGLRSTHIHSPLSRMKRGMARSTSIVRCRVPGRIVTITRAHSPNETSAPRIAIVPQPNRELCHARSISPSPPRPEQRTATRPSLNHKIKSPPRRRNARAA